MKNTRLAIKRIGTICVAVGLLGSPAWADDSDFGSEFDTGLDLLSLLETPLEELLVSGAAKKEQSLDQVSAAATVITGDQLRRFGYRSLAEALQEVAGLYIVNDRMVERVGVRGVQLLGDSNTRLLVLVDGVTVNEPWSQFADAGHGLPLNLDEVQRIEVIRGPVSSVYGTNAFVGIINIVTKQGKNAERGYARLSGGSVGSGQLNAGFARGESNQIRGFASGRFSRGESLVIPEFAEDGADTETNADAMRSLSTGLSGNYGDIRGQVRYGQRSRELPGAPYDTTPGSSDNKAIDGVFLSEVGWAASIGERATVATRAYLNRYDSETTLDLENEGATPQRFKSLVDSTWIGGEIRGSYSLLADGLLDFTAGVATEYSGTESKSSQSGMDETISITKNFWITGLYSEVTTAPTDWASLSVGVRYDHNSLFNVRISPRGALFLRLKKRMGLKLLYAKGFRNPSILESFYEDGARYRASGSELRPESIESKEVVAWYRPKPGIELRASGWRWDLTDIIEKRSVFDPVVLAERFQFQNLAEMRSQGVELEARYRDTKGWLGFANLAVAKVERNEGFEDPINAPVITASTGVSTPIFFDTAHFSTSAVFVSSRNTRDEGVNVDGWLGLNAAVLAPDVRGFDVSLSVRNVLNQRESVPAQSDYDRVIDDQGTLRSSDVLQLPGEGRVIFLRAGHSF